MTYAIKADMQAEFGDTELIQLTDRATPPAGTIDDAVLTAALTRADSEINSYVAKRYALPFAAVPDRIKTAALDIARYYLYDARAPQIVIDRYKQQVAWLRDVANGNAVIVDAAAALISEDSDAGLAVVTSDQVFTDDALALQ